MQLTIFDFLKHALRVLTIYIFLKLLDGIVAVATKLKFPYRTKYPLPDTQNDFPSDIPLDFDTFSLFTYLHIIVTRYCSHEMVWVDWRQKCMRL